MTAAVGNLVSRGSLGVGSAKGPGLLTGENRLRCGHEARHSERAVWTLL